MSSSKKIERKIERTIYHRNLPYISTTNATPENIRPLVCKAYYNQWVYVLMLLLVLSEKIVKQGHKIADKMDGFLTAPAKRRS